VLKYDGAIWACGDAGEPCGGIGMTCADGTIYAGPTPDGRVPMYTTAEGAPSSYKWGAGGVSTPLATCSGELGGAGCQTGKVNSAILEEFGAATYAAAHYCETLTAGGHGDWYLPAAFELAQLYSWRYVIGGFTTAAYWSSSEHDSSLGTTIDFSANPVSPGKPGTLSKGSAARVRCVRPV
jgi:hypothetical protein